MRPLVRFRESGVGGTTRCRCISRCLEHAVSNDTAYANCDHNEIQRCRELTPHGLAMFENPETSLRHALAAPRGHCDVHMGTQISTERRPVDID